MTMTKKTSLLETLLLTTASFYIAYNLYKDLVTLLRNKSNKDNNNNNKLNSPNKNSDDETTTGEEEELLLLQNPNTNSNSNATKVVETNSNKSSIETRLFDRKCEILVHNIAHSDLILHTSSSTSTTTITTTQTNNNPLPSLNNVVQDSSSSDNNAAVVVVCRPRFSYFREICELLWKAVVIDRQEEENSSSSTSTNYNNYQAAVASSSSDTTINDAKKKKKKQLSLFHRLTTTAAPKSSNDKTADVDVNNDKNHFHQKLNRFSVCQLPLYTRTLSTNQLVVLPDTGPAGLDVHNSNICLNERLCRDALRYRGSSSSTDDGSSKNKNNISSLKVERIIFPLLATILPHFVSSTREKYDLGSYNNSNSNIIDDDDDDVKRVIILVSGVGFPRDGSKPSRNSTELLGQLMKCFIHQLYPSITVIQVHSDKHNIFRYEHNLAFIREELLPIINKYRDAHATSVPYPDEMDSSLLRDGRQRSFYSSSSSSSLNRYNIDLLKTFGLTLSFADGSPARTHALQTALRAGGTYSKVLDYYHIWELKTTWQIGGLCYKDVETFSHTEMSEAALAYDRYSLKDPNIELVVNEMCAFKEDYLNALNSNNQECSDIASFWLRKTKKPVLSVLLVRDRTKLSSEEEKGIKSGYKLFRGTNMEVSMPTGSLCAERNVIGTALASNPGLLREDLLLIAVLAIPYNNVAKHKTLSRTGSYVNIQRGGDFQQQKHFLEDALNSKLGVLVDNNNDGDDEDLLLSEYHNSRKSSICSDKSLGSCPGTPKRKVQLYEHIATGGGKSHVNSTNRRNKRRDSRTVMLSDISLEDINPLKPCGACNEWLKKIAECNPYLKVITFTDSDCNGIYVRPCQLDS